MNKIDKFISKKMVQLRKENNLTQLELARLLGLNHHVSIVLMEQGKQSFTVKTIYLMCSIFKIKPNDLFPPVKNAKITKRKKSIITKKVVYPKTITVKHLPKI